MSKLTGPSLFALSLRPRVFCIYVTLVSVDYYYATTGNMLHVAAYSIAVYKYGPQKKKK